MRSRLNRLVALMVVAVAAASCGGGSSPAGGPGAAQPASSAPRANVSLDKNSYPVFPDADAGADPSVPAEQGGKGFKGDGWQTNTTFDLIGDPRAVKGGAFRSPLFDFPSTLRLAGPESNTQMNSQIQSAVYETLLTLHPTTLEYIPALATHWQISNDKLTYRFRLNPNARWSDGQPVVADDVVATWDLMVDKGLQDPSNLLVFGKFLRPLAESKYIVSVKSKQLNWRNFLYFSQSMPILPAHVLKSMGGGAGYIKDFNFKLVPGSGAYTLSEADIVKGKSISLRRRNDYWGEKQRRNIGINNFDEVRNIVVRDQNLMFEMFKKGDLDFYYVGIAREWVQEMNFDKVQRGLIQKAKVFNDNPRGIFGIALNTRTPPLDDVRVRTALQYFLNRDDLINRLFFKEYTPLNSYFAGTIYENPDDPKNPYDPAAALKLLSDAGWTSRDAQGRLTKNGQPLVLEVLYGNKSSERYLTVYQEELRKAGITLNLRLVTPETQFTLIMERKFQTSEQAWTGLIFPNPETSFQSSLADVPNNNNITGFKNKRVDELLPLYDVEFDQQKRAAMIREIDKLVADSHEYVLYWGAASQRLAFWNKFGFPQGHLTRVGDSTDIASIWWNDPDKVRNLDRAIADPSVKLPIDPVEDKYWIEYAKSHPVQSAQ